MKAKKAKARSTERAFIEPFSKGTYQKRRRDLMKELAKEEANSVAIFWSGSELIRNSDSHFPFRAHSDFLYLTGFSEPETALILQIKDGRHRAILALRPRDLSTNRGSEKWEGERLGVERAIKIAGVDEAWSIEDLDSKLFEILKSATAVYWKFGEFCTIDGKLTAMAKKVDDSRRSAQGIKTWRDSRRIVSEMRKKKTNEELQIMKKSADIASLAHIRAMKCIRPGQFEYEVQAETEREFKRHGAQAPAYGSIVATGNNAVTLHYHTNDERIGKNDLLLMDAGCEYYGYASDITRCFPASGRFTEAQKEVYNWVLKAQVAAVKAVRPGVSWRKPHEVAVKILCEGLSKMKIIKKPASEIFKKNLWHRYMPHGTSHWIGLDVHDCGEYYEPDGKLKKLEVGNVLTIEPGLYFEAQDKTVPSVYRGIGVRIEDDVAVTKSGHWVLTENCPKTIAEIEALQIKKF